MDLKKIWNQLMALRSFDNEIIGEILFHVLIGQKFKTCRIVFGSKEKEVRVSTVIFSPTRTGKGEATDVLILVSDELMISTKVETEATTSAIVGTISTSAMENNIKKNYSLGDDGYRNPVVKGDLGIYDIIIYKEAKGLLKPTGHTERLMDVIQEALDDGGYVCKTLSSGCGEEIKYNSSSSIVATSYLLKEQIRETLASQGFFQRTITYVQPVSFENRKVRRKNLIGAYSTDTRKEFVELKNKFIEEINKIKFENERIVMSPEAIGFIDKKITEMENKLEESFQGNILDIIGGFLVSIQDMFFKLSAHYAIIDSRKTVEVKDAAKAFNLIRICSQSVINELLANVDYDNDDKKLALLIKRIYIAGNEEFSKSMLMQIVAQNEKCGMNKSLNLINKMINGKFLQEKSGKGNQKILVIHNKQ